MTLHVRSDFSLMILHVLFGIFCFCSWDERGRFEVFSTRVEGFWVIDFLHRMVFWLVVRFYALSRRACAVRLPRVGV